MERVTPGEKDVFTLRLAPSAGNPLFLFVPALHWRHPVFAEEGAFPIRDSRVFPDFLLRGHRVFPFPLDPLSGIP